MGQPGALQAAAAQPLEPRPGLTSEEIWVRVWKAVLGECPDVHEDPLLTKISEAWGQACSPCLSAAGLREAPTGGGRPGGSHDCKEILRQRLVIILQDVEELLLGEVDAVLPPGPAGRGAAPGTGAVQTRPRGLAARKGWALAHLSSLPEPGQPTSRVTPSPSTPTPPAKAAPV